MSILFNAGDVFDIAIQIERNGAAFYRKAAELVAEKESREELLDLATMEDGHEMTFSELRRQLVEAEDPGDWFEQGGDEALYLENFAQGRVFDMTRDATQWLAPSTPLRDILRFALDRERDSIVFFVGMRDVVPASLGANQIDAIIKQEMGHVTLLSKRLAALDATR